MKVIKYYIVSLFLAFALNFAKGQNCSRKPLCDKDTWENYDYRGQSTSGAMSAGDKADIKIVTYSGQEYKIMVCGEPELGQINFKIVDDQRKYIREVKEVREEEVPVYKENEYGAYETDEWGDYIQTGTEIIYDTIWEKKRIIEEVLIYDSSKDGGNEWYYPCEKTKTLIIKIEVPGENQGFRGCVDVMVGHRSKSRGPSFN